MGPQGMHAYTHIHTENRAEKLSYSIKKKEEEKNHIFTLVTLATCGAFPVSIEMARVLEQEKDRNKHNSESFCRNDMICNQVFASGQDMSKQKHLRPFVEF